MEMIRLYGFPVSNYYNKAKMVLLEKGVAFEEVMVRPSQEESVVSRSPMGKIPFLEIDGEVLVESQVICDWVDEAYPEPPLMPKDALARARVRELLAILETHIELPARRLYREAFFGGTASDDTKKEVERDLAKGVRSLAAKAKFSPYIAGDAFTLADCAALVHLPLVSMATKKIYGRDVLEGFDVKGYLRTCGERPAVRKVNDDRKAAQEAAARK
jgi:glutathione S-transferase